MQRTGIFTSKRLATCLIALALPLCAGGAMAADLPTGEWQLLALNGKTVNAETTFTMDAEGKVSGKAACNRYFGSNTADYPALAFGSLGATRMMCDKIEAETAYLGALGQVTSAELREDHLIMTGSDGVVLEFVRDRDDKGLNCLTCN